MQVGRKIYYDLTTGNVILEVGELQGDVIETSIEQDFETYKVLNERVKKTVGLIKLEYGENSYDFKECVSYKVNLETKKIEFTYKTEEEEKVYENETLTEILSRLEEENLTKTEEITELDFRLVNIELGL